MSHIVSFLSPKGGTGKSTLAICIARALVTLGHSVALIDSDTQGTALYWQALSDTRYGFNVTEGASPPALQQAVDQASTEFVLIDGCAKASTMMLKALRLSDLVLIPVTAGGPDAWASLTLFQTVKAHQAAHGGKPIVAAIINRANKRTRMFRELVRFLDDEGIDRANGQISERTAIGASIGDGSTPFDAKPRDSNAMAELRYLSKQIVEVFA